MKRKRSCLPLVPPTPRNAPILLLLLLLGILPACRTQPRGVVSTTPSAPTAVAGLQTVTPSETPAPTRLLATATRAASVTPTATRPATVASLPPSPTATATTIPAYPRYEGPPLPRDAFGIQIHLHREDLDFIFAHLEALEMGWVKVQVSWKVFEPRPGEYDQELFTELDRLVERAEKEGIRVLLGVAKAPEWSRPTTALDGPPSDPGEYQSFMRLLASRYRGQVAAYELWNEPNLQREWNGFPLDPVALVTLLRYGAQGVREADESALIISGAPATTGINDGVTAIDDRLYLQGMLQAGIGQIVDAVGVHPYGWANPPDARAADTEQVSPSHNNHPSFFFADTLADYRALLAAAGYPEMPLWVTEFGWGSFEEMDAPPPEGAEFMDNVGEWQQAEYTLRAYELAQAWGNSGPLFLWNLNFAPTFGPAFAESGYSVLRPDGSPRPVYYALQSIEKEETGE